MTSGLGSTPSRPRSGVHAAVAAVTLGLLAGSVAVLVGRGAFPYVVVAAAVTVLGALLLLVVAASSFAAFSSRGWLGRTRRAASVVGIACVVQGAFLAAGLVVRANDVEATKRYCERLIERLEEYRQTAGRYPSTLAEIADGHFGETEMFRRSGQFVSAPDAFVMSFDERDGLVPSVVQYSSQTRRWTRF